MKQFFKELFEYNHYFNQKLADEFSMHPERISEKAVKLYSHILNAHQIWNSRIESIEKHFGVWDLHAHNRLKEIDNKNFESSMLILDKNDLGAIINYTNTKGQKYSNTIRDTLFHIINHSTNHRAQIASEFRMHGLEPVVTDYIFYKRTT